MNWPTKSKFLPVFTIRYLRFWMTAPIAALIVLAATDLAMAQTPNMLKHKFIEPHQIMTIRMLYHPDLSPPHVVMDIYLKDPKQPVFHLIGDTGNTVETFRHMQELAIMFKKQSFTLIYDGSASRTQTIHPYLTPGNFSRRMFNIVGFYGIGFSAQGPVPDGEEPSINMIPAQTMPTTNNQPPPDEQMGFCCLHGEVIEIPVHACEMEGGTFFRDPESASIRCHSGGRR